MVAWQNGGNGDRQPAVARHRAGHGAPGRADASRGAPLPHPSLGWGQDDPRREVGGDLRPDGPGDRARLAHARPHLYRPARYADAAYQQEGSARVDHAYMFRDRVMPFEIHNYAHNNQWLCTSDSHIGRVHDAIAVARNLVEQPRDPQKNGPNDGGSPQRYGRLRWSEVLVRYEMWDDLIEATTSGAIDWTNIPQEQVQRAHTLGLAYAAKEDAKHLAEQVEALKKLTVPVGEDRAGGAGGLPAPGPRRRRPGLRPVRQGDLDADRGPRPGASGGPQLWVRRERGEEGRGPEPRPGPADGGLRGDPPGRRQGEGGPRGLRQARADGPMGRSRHAGLPPHRRDRRPLEGRQDLEGPRAHAGPVRRLGRDRDQPDRPDDPRPAGLGPLPRRAARRHRHRRQALVAGRVTRAAASW